MGFIKHFLHGFFVTADIEFFIGDFFIFKKLFRHLAKNAGGSSINFNHLV